MSFAERAAVALNRRGADPKPTFKKKERHLCEGCLPSDSYGGALNECREDDQGRLWVSNGEYASAVNFCPYCGYKASTQVEVVL